jgi:hypothetical protein
MDMSEEKKPSVKILLPQGWRQFKIVGCEEKTSKAGNLMFVLSAQDKETGYIDTWYAIAEAKKRWFLKSILVACGCKAGQDGVYDWEISDIMNKNVLGFVVHEDNEYINRDGETVKTKQHKVSDIMEAQQDEPKKEMTEEERQKAIDADQIAWDS